MKQEILSVTCLRTLAFGLVGCEQKQPSVVEPPKEAISPTPNAATQVITKISFGGFWRNEKMRTPQHIRGRLLVLLLVPPGYDARPGRTAAGTDPDPHHYVA